MSRSLTITLYPLIPDAGKDHHQTYLARMKREFEALHPDVDLTLQIGMDHNTYDPKYLTQAFSENLVDAVEVDGLTLSFLVNNNWATAISDLDDTNSANIYPQAIQAFTGTDHQLYAYPTALCSCFLFSSHPEIVQATDLWQLLELLQQKDQNVPKILGSFFGVSVIPIFYGLFYAGLHGRDKINTSLTSALDPAVLRLMKLTLLDSINHLAKTLPQPLADEAVFDPYWALTDYLAGKGLSYLGFSENLHHLLDMNADQIVYYRPALFGHHQPVLFANGLVINKVGLTRQRAEDVAAFAKYYTSLETIKWRSLAEDTGGPPRYLLSHRRDFFDLPEIRKNHYYSSFSQVLDEGVIFPNQGFLENRDTLAKTINQFLAN